MTTPDLERSAEELQVSKPVSMLRAALCMLASIGASSLAHAQGVRIVEPTGTANFATIQAAIDAAQNGDVILVAPGVYSGFTIPYKALTIAATSNSAVSVHGDVRILGLPTGNQVALVGFRVLGAFNALWISNCTGNVLLQDCAFANNYGNLPILEVTSSFSVAFVGCSALKYFDSTYASLSGASDGLRSSNSAIAAYDCVFEGYDAWDDCDETVFDGGWGYRGEPGSFLFASGTLARGGRGGLEWCHCGTPGVGGAGFSVDYAAELYLLGSTAIAGPPMTNYCGVSAGSYPALFNQGGNLLSYPGAARKLGPRNAVISDNADWSLSISGQVGDRIYLPGNRVQGMRFMPSLFGVWLIGQPTEPGPLLGVVPSSGVLAAQKFIQDVPLPLTQRTIFSQVVAVDSAGKRILGPPTVRIVLNRESGPDCNANGVQDYIEIIEGLVPDLNHNLIPDTCPGG